MAKYILRTGKLTICVLLPLFVIGLIIWAFCHKTYAQLDSDRVQVPDLNATAQAYYDEGAYGDAEEIWLTLMQESPEIDVSKQATEGLICLYAQIGNDPNAFDLLATYIEMFPDEDATAETIGRVASIYQSRKCYPVARALHQSVTEKWPGTDRAMVSLSGMALAQISMGDDPNAVSTIDSLIVQYTENPEICDVLCDLAGQCSQQAQYAQALEIYRRLELNWPDDADHYMMAEVSMRAISDIGYGDNPGTQVSLSLLAETYSQSSNLASALWQVSSIYYSKATRCREVQPHQENLYKSIEAGQLAMEYSKTSDLSAQACYQLAESYRLLGKEEAAIGYYRLLLSDWPDYEYAWNAQFMIGRCSEKLAYKGLIDASVAQSTCTEAYQNVCQIFPVCPAVKAASAWLKSHRIIN